MPQTLQNVGMMFPPEDEADLCKLAEALRSADDVDEVNAICDAMQEILDRRKSGIYVIVNRGGSTT